MEKQSMVSGGKGLALAGSAVAVVLVLLGFVFSGRLAPPDRTVSDETMSPAPAAAPQGAVPSGDAPVAAVDDAATPAATDGTPSDTVTTAQAADTETPAQSEPAQSAPAQSEAAQAEPALAAPASTDPATSAATVAAPEAAAPTDQAAPTAAPATEATVDTVATDAPAATSAATPPVPAEIRPSFDTVRLAPDGEALVAGRAIAGSTVDILLDGIVVGTAMTAGDGAFVAFLSLPPSDAPRVLTLAITKDATVLESEQQVIIAPVQQPEVAVAAASGATDAPSPQSAPDDQTASTPPAVAPALLLSDTSGVRVLQPATPADPARIGGIALDVISYTSEGDVLLQGRATSAANVLIYLDNTPVTSAPVGADGIWSTGLPGVAPGIYTLRLDEVDTTGKVLSRIETPFKREDRDEVAAIAAASAPAAASPTTSAPASATTADGAGTQAASATAEAATIAATGAPATTAVRVVTVQPGNTLWAIARESYGEGPLFVRVFEANRDRIRDPDLIYPGQIFEIPE